MSSPTVMPTQNASFEADSAGGLRHIKALDGLRGLAILLILFDHLFWSNTHTGNRVFDLINAIRSSSWVGVNLFFALSGFLITGILFETLGDSNYFKTFYARRTLRIFPVYYGFLLFIFILTKPLHLQWNGWQYYHLTYTSNLALWRTGVPLDLRYFNLNHFWSLDVEEQFYLIWPFVVYRVKDAIRLIRMSLWACLVVLMIRTTLVIFRSHFSNPYLTYSPTFSCADNLLFGCCLALALRTNWRERVHQLAPRIFVACGAILLLLFFRSPDGIEFNNPLVATFGLSAIGIMSTSLIAMTLRASSMTKDIFNNPVLRFFGRYSYGLYVYHYSIDGNISPWLRKWFGAHFHYKIFGVLGATAVSTIICVAVAFTSYHLFEVQFLKLKKYFAYASHKSSKKIVV
jgi:peptidoglycan/LPS O-acetylase OafA/YrhL